MLIFSEKNDIIYGSDSIKSIFVYCHKNDFSLLFGQLTMMITVRSEKIYNHSKSLHDITEI